MDRIKEKRELKAINPMLFLVAIIVIVAIASYIVPAGSYDRVYDAVADRNVVDPGSYHLVDKNPISIFSLLMSVTLGMQNAAYIIFFLLIIGGMFAILNGTGAINAGMSNVVRAMRGKELLMIPVCMVVFGCGSAFCANFEEFLAFVPLVLACCLTMGFDSLTAVEIIFCAAASGYAGAVTNAFTTGVAQSIAGLPMFSGMGLRVAVFVVLLAVSITYVMWHARRVKRDPHLSSTYEIDRITAQNVALDVDNVERLNGRQKLVLVVFIAGIAFTVWGIGTQGYYSEELAAIFLAIGIIGGVIGGLRPSEICDHFEKGCVNMLFPCLMVGLANAVIILIAGSQHHGPDHPLSVRFAEWSASHDGRLRHVCGAGSIQCAGSLWLRSSGDHHAHYGAFGGYAEYHPADLGSGVPDGRCVHQRDGAHRRRNSGGTGHVRRRSL